MRHTAFASKLAVWLMTPLVGMGAPAFLPEPIEVGRNLQMHTSVRLSERAPETGLPVTIRSDDPKRLRLALNPETEGQESITLKVGAGMVLTPEFWVQAAGDPGPVTYTVSAPGYSSAKGTVTVTPSALLVLGPFRAPSFSTTPRSPGVRITIVSARLNEALEVMEEQYMAKTTELKLRNSDPGAGTLRHATLRIPGGSSQAETEFKPSALGKATLTVEPLPGFSVPTKFSSVTAWVERPGLAITQDLILAKDMEEEGLVYLGEPAPPEGLEVKLSSSDPQKMVLSASEDKLGSGVLILKVPSGQVTARYYLQGLGDSGKITYKAEAPGFRSALAAVTLAKPGVIVAFAPYGPPDEAAVLRKSDLHDTRRFYASLGEARSKPVRLALFTGFIHPVSGRMADITLQRLRAGVSITVELTSSNPAVAKVASPVTIPSGKVTMETTLTPLAVGEAIISISQPPGFGKPENATWVPVTVRE
jgi:hypothetical protein